VGKREPTTAIYSIDAGVVPGRFETRSKESGNKWKENPDCRPGARLMIDVKDGRIVDAFSIGAFKRTHDDVDFSGLGMDGNSLSGTAKIIVGGRWANVRLAGGRESVEKTVSFTTAVGKDGAVSAWWGTNAPNPKARGPHVALFNRPDAMPGTGTFWVRFSNSPKGGEGFAVLPIKAEGSGSGTFLYNKGLPMGTVDSSAITVKDGKVSGTLTGKIGNYDTVVTLEGRLFANRMYLGEYTMKAGENEIRDRFRAGIMPEGCPSLINNDKDMLAVVKPQDEKWKAEQRVLAEKARREKEAKRKKQMQELKALEDELPDL